MNFGRCRDHFIEFLLRFSLYMNKKFILLASLLGTNNSNRFSVEKIENIVKNDRFSARAMRNTEFLGQFFECAARRENF